VFLIRRVCRSKFRNWLNFSKCLLRAQPGIWFKALWRQLWADPTPSSLTRRPGELCETWPGDGSSGASSEFNFFFSVCLELLQDAPQGKIKKIPKIFDAPDDLTPVHIGQGFQRRRVTRRASSRPGARRWSGFARAVETGTRRAGPEPPQSRRRWAAAGKFRRRYGRVMGQKRRRRRALRGAVGGGGRRGCAL
jgi:hypothetical protein